MTELERIETLTKQLDQVERIIKVWSHAARVAALLARRAKSLKAGVNQKASWARMKARNFINHPRTRQTARIAGTAARIAGGAFVLAAEVGQHSMRRQARASHPSYRRYR